MPSCSGRNLLYAILALQLISTLERQVFDFLGFMWIPILSNFVHTLVVILGIFGVYQYTSIHLLTYLVWCLLWSAWNIFVICYYMDIGNLKLDDQTSSLLTFGTGSYSWWYEHGPGCKVTPFPPNDSLPSTGAGNSFWGASDPDIEFRVDKPYKVDNCLLNYEYIEVIHAGIQLLLVIFAYCFGVPLAHYLVTVVEPKYRQNLKKQPLSNGHAMYSIEYNQVNETTGGNTQETDFYSLESTANGDVRPHMTPRRVKRRSYTRSSARSAGKALKKELHTRQSGRSVRSASGALGTSGRPNKSINPVTRLMQETETHHPTNDSSTSNEDPNTAKLPTVERYGQVNPGYVGQVNPGYVSSRPNSLYSHVNQHGGPQSITDYEASRPPSALTSYSNFHGQRRPGANHNSIVQQQQQIPQQKPLQLTQESFNQFDEKKLINASFDDDLPPPPPPLSSSPTLAHQNRNLNLPQEDTDNNSSITTDTTAQMPVPLQRNNANRRNEYVNMPVSLQSVSSHPMPAVSTDIQSISSASPDLSNPHGPPFGGGVSRNINGAAGGGAAPPLPPHNYANMPVNKNPLPPPRNDDQRYTSKFNRPNQRFSTTDQSSADERNINLNQEPDLSYNDTQTLRADQRLNYPPPPKENDILMNGHHQNQFHEKTQFRQLHLDYDMNNKENNISHEQQATIQQQNSRAEPQQQQATRIPSGHMRRDRASLRAKHRKEMEQAKIQKHRQHLQSKDEDDYGFSKGGAQALPNGHQAPQQQGGPPGAYGGPSGSNDDKWYLHDSMRPVGAPAHGGNCKCYRCQRKLTAI